MRSAPVSSTKPPPRCHPSTNEVALEQKNAELEQSHQFIFSVLSAMSDVLLVCDAQGRIVETNAANLQWIATDYVIEDGGVI